MARVNLFSILLTELTPPAHLYSLHILQYVKQTLLHHNPSRLVGDFSCLPWLIPLLKPPARTLARL